MNRRGIIRAALAMAALVAVALLVRPLSARASTYAVYIPLDSSIYRALDTLNGLGYLDSYLPEIKPITRVEAARLTLEAGANLDTRGRNPLAVQLIKALRAQLKEEIDWVDNDREDNLPTMLHPVQRVEGQYVYSSGQRESLSEPHDGVNYQEGTPLLPYNDNLPTSSGSNEVVRWSGWAGIGGFLTGYGEGAIAGPLTHNASGANRAQLLTGAGVVGLGNVAISFGQEEMAWGVGRFGLLSQSNNALPFPALRVQNIHPSHLPWMLRYLGLFRWQVFMGQLDADRTYARPWIDGEILSFKPLPWFEYGIEHTIMFGGRGNDNYGFAGFAGRATGLDTGNPSGANTNSRGGLWLKLTIPQLRGAQLYTELLGEDNLTKEVPGIGRFLPFLSLSYQVGFYEPRVTEDGLTDFAIEYTNLQRDYSRHSDSLYWTYDNALMGNAMGPGASSINASVGRWFADARKFDLGILFERRSPIGIVQLSSASREFGYGITFDYFEIPLAIRQIGDSLGEVRASTAVEYVEHINFGAGSSVRTMFQLTFGLTPAMSSLEWK